MNDPLPEVPSPCTSVCQLDPHTSLCRGCLRTIQEIASWAAYTAPEKRAVLARIAQRRTGATSGV